MAGTIKASQDYSSGLLVAVNELGAGRFIVNPLHIRENLGSHPVTDRLLNKLLRLADGGRPKPLTDLPAAFEAHLKSIGYK